MLAVDVWAVRDVSVSCVRWSNALSSFLDDSLHRARLQQNTSSSSSTALNESPCFKSNSTFFFADMSSISLSKCAVKSANGGRAANPSGNGRKDASCSLKWFMKLCRRRFHSARSFLHCFATARCPA